MSHHASSSDPVDPLPSPGKGIGVPASAASARVQPLALVPDADSLASSLAAEGWRIVRVGQAASLREALVRIGEALHFPGYYGVNLDALTDCLRDLPGPTALVWRGWKQLAVSDPDGWARLVPVLRMGAEGQPPFAVLLAD